MKLGVGAWIGIIVGGLGGLIGMAVGIAASPVFGSIFSLIMIIIFGSVFGTMFRGMAVKNKLIKNGVSASARVVEVHDTGVTVNNSPQIKLLLEVTPPNGSPYMVETKELISRLQTSLYQAGQILPVKIDLDNKNICAIDYSAGDSSASSYTASSYDTSGASSSASNPSSVLQGPWAGISAEESNRRLAEINAANMQLISTGESAKAIITKYTWLGIYVNGENPAVQFELEVLPASDKPFKATSIGVIMDTSVPKYQPGCEIFVAYDRNDTSKVTIAHS